jgi:hypothetical protein
MTKRTVVLLALLAASGLLMTGCESKESAADTTPKLCGGCGQIKGSDVCCKADAEECDGCGLAKGSPGCCKIEKGQDVALCAGCGQIKGSDVCCKADAEKCGTCGLAKGSPGCCKIK